MGTQMKVLLSWSGDRSRLVALALRSWLPDVLQAIDPFMSDEDIEKGARWRETLDGQLASTSACVICLTPENVKSPWIHFEAGAISRVVSGESAVIPYLVGLTPADLASPLTAFNAASANERDTLRTVQSLNRLLPSPLDNERVGRIFEREWPRLEALLREIPAPVVGAPRRPADEILAEILDHVRALRATPRERPSRRPLPDDVGTVTYLHRLIRRAVDGDLTEADSTFQSLLKAGLIAKDPAYPNGCRPTIRSLALEIPTADRVDEAASHDVLTTTVA